MPVVPAEYGVTDVYLRLRVAERFGMRPAEIDAMEPGMVAMLLAYERIRQAEEVREAELWLSR